MYGRTNKSFWSQLPPVTKNLIIINLIIWAFMFFGPAHLTQKLTDFGGLHYVESSKFYPWQFVTYMFMHDPHNLAHIFFNMFALLMFGVWIEMSMGKGRFLFYYLSCGIGAAIVQEGAWALTINSFLAKIYQVPAGEVEALMSMGRLEDVGLAMSFLVTVGASGAIYGILLAFGMLFPNQRLSIMFLPVFIKAKWAVIGYGIMELLIGMSNANDGIAHFAHLGGMIFGVLMILYWKKKRLINGPYN